MPAVRTYIVTQEREVKVTAESPTHAVETARGVFNNKEDADTVSLRLPRETRIEAREEF